MGYLWPGKKTANTDGWATELFNISGKCIATLAHKSSRNRFHVAKQYLIRLFNQFGRIVFPDVLACNRSTLSFENWRVPPFVKQAFWSKTTEEDLNPGEEACCKDASFEPKHVNNKYNNT